MGGKNVSNMMSWSRVYRFFLQTFHYGLIDHPLTYTQYNYYLSCLSGYICVLNVQSRKLYMITIINLHIFKKNKICENLN